ncbi:MAG: hypothetical protein NVS1B6_01190 [Steroidobacteraceae bacterium]
MSTNFEDAGYIAHKAARAEALLKMSLMSGTRLDDAVATTAIAQAPAAPAVPNDATPPESEPALPAR